MTRNGICVNSAETRNDVKFKSIEKPEGENEDRYIETERRNASR